MSIAIWIIAVCEVIRATQNMIQIGALLRDTRNRDNAYAEFIKSLKATDREFVKRMPEEYQKQEGTDELGVTD